MDLWQLRTFCAVARENSFTRASEVLNLSQPAVSRHIKFLEAELSSKLFVRSADGAELTEVGRLMLVRAERVLDIADDLKSSFDGEDRELEGSLVVGGVTRGLENPLYSLDSGFRNLFPNIEDLFQAEQTFGDEVSKTAQADIDVGIVASETKPNSLEVLPFGDYSLVLVANPNHPLARQKSVSSEHLENVKWVHYENGNCFRKTCDDRLSSIGVEMRNIHETNDGALIRSIVANSDRLSLLPLWGVAEDLRRGSLVKISLNGEQLMSSLNLVFRENRKSQPFCALITFLMGLSLVGVIGRG